MNNLSEVTGRALLVAQSAWPTLPIQNCCEGNGLPSDLRAMECGIERLFGAELMADGANEIWLRYLWTSLQDITAYWEEQLQ